MQTFQVWLNNNFEKADNEFSRGLETAKQILVVLHFLCLQPDG